MTDSAFGVDHGISKALKMPKFKGFASKKPQKPSLSTPAKPPAFLTTPATPPGGQPLPSFLQGNKGAGAGAAAGARKTTANRFPITESFRNNPGAGPKSLQVPGSGGRPQLSERARGMNTKRMKPRSGDFR